MLNYFIPFLVHRSTNTYLPVFTLVAMTFVIGLAQAQAPQFKLENPDEGFTTGGMGRAVAVDGDTMIVGAPLANFSIRSNTELARIYRADGLGGWTLEAELTADDAAPEDFFGNSVAISGNTAVVGANGDGDAGDESGSAYVFVRSGGAWTQQAKLTASDAARSDFFGASVSVSGNTIAVGALRKYGVEGSGGSAYIFTRSGEIWSEQAKLTADDAEAVDAFGFSVSISGNTVVVGSRRNADAGPASGAAYVFTRSGENWSQEAKLTANDAERNDLFGNSVSISGNKVIIGAFGDDDAGDTSGSAYVFARSRGSWSQQVKLTASDATADDWFGFAVSISGNTAVVGAYADDDAGSKSGSAYIFTCSDGVWSEQAKLTAADAVDLDEFGYAVAISGDTAVVGAYLDDDAGDSSGSAYVFTRSAELWSQQAKVNATDTAASDEFGSSVSVWGNTAVIGAVGDNSAYVYTRTGWAWVRQAKLTVPGVVGFDQFGSSVSISGDTIVVGAERDEVAGSAYVFTRSNGVWSQQGKLKASDGDLFDQFGSSVSVSGDTAVIGAYHDDDDGVFRSGSAYVYTRSGNLWSEQAKLPISDKQVNHRIGWSVSVSGDTAIIGAPDDDLSIQNTDAGSVYVFTRSGGVWSEQAKLTASDADQRDYFGYSVSISGDTAIIGAYRDDDKGDGSGSVYVFTRSG
jgi:hypothetical protein